LIQFGEDGTKVIEEEYEDASTQVPFNYRGGYVGYLGYEVRHDTRQSMCKQEICSVSDDDTGVDNEYDQISNPHVPTAAFLFADRSLVYDHWRGDWYMVGVVNSHKVVSDSAQGGKKNQSKDDMIKWMHSITKNLASLSLEKSDLSNFLNNPSSSSTDSNPIQFSLSRSKSQYSENIERCHREIKNGESYELCLTNQLRTNVSFERKQGLSTTPFGLYKRLRQKNPAPFAAFLKFDSSKRMDEIRASMSICCSSPERFLSISKAASEISTKESNQMNHGWEFAPPFVSSNDNDSKFIVESKPIKGTSKRNINDDGVPMDVRIELDAKNAEDLRTSVKNRAENLMIVDLLRNDLSRICEPGSVHVPKLMAIESFATVHQMVSTIRGLVNPCETPIDVIAACFPGGSMTGAPKLRSVDILNDMEMGKSRGPYSGCLGYISLNGCMDMNIIIRTAVVTPATKSQPSSHVNHEESWDVTIGAGGAITALSECEDEYDELQLKARAVKDSIQEWHCSGSN